MCGERGHEGDGCVWEDGVHIVCVEGGCDRRMPRGNHVCVVDWEVLVCVCRLLCSRVVMVDMCEVNVLYSLIRIGVYVCSNVYV